VGLTEYRTDQCGCAYSVVVELSAGRTPSFIADCCNVYQALENSLVLVPEIAHLRIFILRCTNVLIITRRVLEVKLHSLHIGKS